MGLEWVVPNINAQVSLGITPIECPKGLLGAYKEFTGNRSQIEFARVHDQSAKVYAHKLSQLRAYRRVAKVYAHKLSSQETTDGSLRYMLTNWVG
jgi:hypothetical protein